MKKKSIIISTIIFSILSFSCKKKVEDPHDHNDEELITTVKIKYINSNNDILWGTFTDIDGEGGNAPTVTHDILKANTSYKYEIYFLNESVQPTDTISNEVKEEAVSHQVFLTANSDLKVTIPIENMDKDINGVPVGLTGKFNTQDASNGKLTLTLKHQPNSKPVSGNGDITIGSTDVEVTFDVSVQ